MSSCICMRTENKPVEMNIFVSCPVVDLEDL